VNPLPQHGRTIPGFNIPIPGFSTPIPGLSPVRAGNNPFSADNMRNAQGNAQANAQQTKPGSPLLPPRPPSLGGVHNTKPFVPGRNAAPEPQRSVPLNFSALGQLNLNGLGLEVDVSRHGGRASSGSAMSSVMSSLNAAAVDDTVSISDIMSTWQKSVSDRILAAYTAAEAQAERDAMCDADGDQEVRPELVARYRSQKRDDALSRQMKQMSLEKTGTVHIRPLQSVRQLAIQARIKVMRVLQILQVLDNVPRTGSSLINAETAELVIAELGLTSRYVAFDATGSADKLIEGNSDQVRAPVVCIMGHVDHGKTTLLDAFRETNVVSAEAGRITQSIGGFSIPAPESLREFIPAVTFLDTPGHAIFRSMRERGTQRGLTDIAIIIIAATDGVQPQTREAVRLAREAKLPMIIAVTKIDVDGCSPRGVLDELYAELDVHTEPLGGDIPAVQVCAPKKEGLEELLEVITTIAQDNDVLHRPRLEYTAEQLESWHEFSRAIARGDSSEATVIRKHKHGDVEVDVELPVNDVTDLMLGYGYVVEAEQERGVGAVLNVVVRQGEMRVGDHVLCGLEVGTIKSITNDRGESVDVAHARLSLPVQIAGINPETLDDIGDDIVVLPSFELAKSLCERREKELEALDMIESSESTDAANAIADPKRFKLRRRRITALQVRTTEAERQEIEAQEDRLMTIMIKGDVKGSVEAVEAYIDDLQYSKHINFVDVNVVRSALGNEITTADVDFVKNRGGDVIFGFNVKLPQRVQEHAIEHGVRVYSHEVIFHLFDAFRDELTKKLPRMPVDKVHGTAALQQLFPLSMSKIGLKRLSMEASHALGGEPVAIEGKPTVSGSRVLSGELVRSLPNEENHSPVMYRARRDNVIVREGLTCLMLKHFKDEVTSVEKGKECGVLLSNVDGLMEGDTIECYQTVMTYTPFDDSQARGHRSDQAKTDWKNDWKKYENA
jgi:translation initiation factor IF-2